MPVIPFQKPDTQPLIKVLSRINAVRSVAHDLYWEREEGATTLRDLEKHEQRFLDRVNFIQKHFKEARKMGLRDLGGKVEDEAYRALCFLNYRTEAETLEAALATYKDDCERFEFDALEAMAFGINNEAAE